MSFTNSSNKGKGRQVANEWSDWQWDERGNRYASFRIDSAGFQEWTYKYPDPTPQPETPRSSTYPPPDLSHYPNSYGSNSGENYQTFTPGSQAGSIPGPIIPSPWANQNIVWAKGFNTSSLTNVGTAPTLYTNRSLNSPLAVSQYGSLGAAQHNNTNPATIDSITQGLQRFDFNPYHSSGQGLPQQSDLSRETQTSLNPAEVYPNSRVIRDYTRDQETLDSRYSVVPDHQSKNFWKPGRVFMMLWSEPAGEKSGNARAGTTNNSHISTVSYGGKVFSEIRRFVVVKDQHGSCICIAIHTYSGQATLKSNLPDPENHAIIYTSSVAPGYHSMKGPDGVWKTEHLIIDKIKVNGTDKYPEGTLDPKSRIHFSKIYTVEKNVRILNIGVVAEMSMRTLDRWSPVKMAAYLAPLASTRNPATQQRQSQRDSATRKDNKTDGESSSVFIDVPRTSSNHEYSNRYDQPGPSSRRDSHTEQERSSGRRRNSVAQHTSSSRRDKSQPPDLSATSKSDSKHRHHRKK